MNKKLLSKLKDCLSKYNSKEKYKKVLIVLAIIVVLGTCYVLMEPAITIGEKLICQIEEHTHTDECYTEKFICEETDENKENQECYELELTCKSEEHTHDSSCYAYTEDDPVTYLNDLINNIPTLSEMKSKIEGLTYIEEATIYYNETIDNVKTAFETYQKLENSSKEQITDISKIEEYVNEGLLENRILDNLLEGKISLEDENTITSTPDTSDVNSISTYSTNETSTYEGSNARLANNNSSKLQTTTSADTSDIIEVNLYDYGSNSNYKYLNVSTNYPIFQQPGGTSKVTNPLGYASFNFGDNITSDLEAGVYYVTYGTTNPTNINQTQNAANSPLSGVMKNTIGSDDYPAIKDGSSEISMKYLFTNNTYATKQNTANINGLFKYNSTTGAYTFDSRSNHAQFNASNNTFTLYNQIITSNFMMYPFGNFLPFNDIVTQTTQASTIDRSYFTNIQSSATTKAGTTTNTTFKNAYTKLASVLSTFVDVVDSTKGNTSWTGADVTNLYFDNVVKVDNNAFTNDSLSNIYSIDYDEATNFFFGLEMKMDFIQPKNGLTGTTGTEPMVFEFSGDDDVLVYIDDVLFLDLSGIHRHVGGKIDFVNGKVYYYDFDKTTGDTTALTSTDYVGTNPKSFSEILNAAGKSTDVLNSNGTFKNYSSHNFKFYYMERGAGSGVMKMNFNFPLIPKNTISVTKDLDLNSTALIGNPDFSFQILKANDTTKTEELFIAAGTTYDVLNSNGVVVRTATVGDNGIFKIKAGETARFNGISADAGSYYVREILDPNWTSQYASVTVDGTSTTVNNNVEVNSETFTGYESGIKDISDGHTAFLYTNKVTTNTYGSLKITKNLVGFISTDLTKSFNFEIKLDNEFLPSGTIYDILNSSGTKIGTGVVGDNGIFTLKTGETASFVGIIAGSYYEIKEVGITTGYQVGYTVNGTPVTSSSVSGYIDNTSIGVTITNTERGSSIPITIIKDIENPNKDSHNYKFKLVEVTNSTGNVLADDGIELESSLDVTNTNQKNMFTLTYLQLDYENIEIGRHYYKITEVDEKDINTKYDNRNYVIEVTITNNNDTFTAELTNVWIDGVAITNDNKEIKFINQLLTELTISKQVNHSSSEDAIFEFQIEVKYKGNPITGEYSYEKGSEKDNLILDSTGKTTINLKHNESLTIYGLPYSSTYKVTELTTTGYVVEYQVNSDSINVGTEASGTLENDTNTVKFINSSGYILPDTGSHGMLILIIIGSLLFGLPVIYIGYTFYKRGKKVT